jgi:hypothetical protein
MESLTAGVMGSVQAATEAIPLASMEAGPDGGVTGANYATPEPPQWSPALAAGVTPWREVSARVYREASMESGPDGRSHSDHAAYQTVVAQRSASMESGP